jgi:hypothetical protein
MASRLDYFFKQTVAASELDEGFADLEAADWQAMADNGFFGVASGLAVAAQGTPDMTVSVATGAAYSVTGKRAALTAPATVNGAVDYLLVNTAVARGENEKYISIFLYPARVLSDPRVDGNGTNVYLRRTESFTIHVVQGAEAPAGTATPPALDTNGVLLADVLLAFGSTAITTGMIDLITRRQDAFVAGGTPRSLRSARALGALAQLLGFYNAHVTGGADKHTAADVNYAGSGAWADATALPASSVEAAVDAVVAALASTAGAGKVGSAAIGTLLGAGTVSSQLNTLDGIIEGSKRTIFHAHAGWDDTTTTGTLLLGAISTPALLVGDLIIVRCNLHCHVDAFNNTGGGTTCNWILRLRNPTPAAIGDAANQRNRLITDVTFGATGVGDAGQRCFYNEAPVALAGVHTIDLQQLVFSISGSATLGSWGNIEVTVLR